MTTAAIKRNMWNVLFHSLRFYLRPKLLGIAVQSARCSSVPQYTKCSTYILLWPDRTATITTKVSIRQYNHYSTSYRTQNLRMTTPKATPLPKPKPKPTPSNPLKPASPSKPPVHQPPPPH